VRREGGEGTRRGGIDDQRLAWTISLIVHHHTQIAFAVGLAAVHIILHTHASTASAAAATTTIVLHGTIAVLSLVD